MITFTQQSYIFPFMKRFLPLFFFLAALLPVMAGCREGGSKVLLRSNEVLFDTAVAPAAFVAPEAGFTIVASLTLADFDGNAELMSVPGVLAVRLRQHDRADIAKQNYPAGPMPDGRVPVLEAALTLYPPEGASDMTVGVPLGLLPEPWGKHDLVLQFTGVAWEMYIDGRLVDRDYAFGYPLPFDATALDSDGSVVGGARIFSPCLAARELPASTKEYKEAQYFNPRGHNSWVGDVATIWYKGRYHVFYLLDRRGHQGKFGRGGHYFEHLSTADFKHWTEHEAATPIEHQWETFGTGVPFVWHDSLMVSYGMHTSRLYPYEQTASPREWEHIKQFGFSEVLPFESLEDGIYPSGTTFSVSRDGVSNFEKSRIILHPSENPTIYTDPDGQLCMLANYGSRGTWTASDLRGPWSCISEDFPPGGDCTFIFTWGGWQYIVGGFTNMWKKPVPAPIEDYEDVVAQGLDLYDGLCVPSITQIGDGRYLMAGWVMVNGHWGGPLVVRELLQQADGTIGSRFMPEMMPATGRSRLLARSVGEEGLSAETLCRSFVLTFDVEPAADGHLSLKLGEGFQWDLDAAAGRAQFSSDGSPAKSLREGGAPHCTSEYAIENIRGLDAPFTVRIVVKGEPKWGGSLVDVEIAGRRTMITHRGSLSVDNLAITPAGLTIKNIRLSACKE